MRVSSCQRTHFWWTTLQYGTDVLQRKGQKMEGKGPSSCIPHIGEKKDIFKKERFLLCKFGVANPCSCSSNGNCIIAVASVATHCHVFSQLATSASSHRFQPQFSHISLFSPPLLVFSFYFGRVQQKRGRKMQPNSPKEFWLFWPLLIILLFYWGMNGRLFSLFLLSKISLFDLPPPLGERPIITCTLGLLCYVGRPQRPPLLFGGCRVATFFNQRNTWFPKIQNTKYRFPNPPP